MKVNELIKLIEEDGWVQKKECAGATDSTNIY